MRLSTLFKQVVDKLQAEKVTFAIAGGLAASVYRDIDRFTADLDFLIALKDNEIKRGQLIIESFGLESSISRKADIEGGPMFAIKKKNTLPYIIVGRHPTDKKAVGFDLLLPNIPWFQSALSRAQNNIIDFGVCAIPCLTVEDVILAKFYSLRNDSKRYKDLDDLRSIFASDHQLDLAYLCKQMSELKLPIPESTQEIVPAKLRRLSKSIMKSFRTSNFTGDRAAVKKVKKKRGKE